MNDRVIFLCVKRSVVDEALILKEFYAKFRMKYFWQSIRSAFLGAPFPGARSYFTGARKERAPFLGEGTQVGARS